MVKGKREILSIKTAIQVKVSGCDIFVVGGDKVKVTDINGKEYTGIFYRMDLGKYEEEDDTIILGNGYNIIEIQQSDVKDIKVLEN